MWLLPLILLPVLQAQDNFMECRMVSGNPGLCVPIRFLHGLGQETVFVIGDVEYWLSSSTTYKNLYQEVETKYLLECNL